MMMKNMNAKSVGRTLMILFGIFLMLPAVQVAAQDDDWRRNERRNDRRNERREERREDNWERRNDSNNQWDNRGGRRQGRRGRGWDGHPNYGGSFQLRQTALNAGYNNGIEEGRKDRSRRRRFEYQDKGDYRSATDDYNSRLGDRELYRRYFRSGFETGYRDGYEGY